MTYEWKLDAQGKEPYLIHIQGHVCSKAPGSAMSLWSLSILWRQCAWAGAADGQVPPAALATYAVQQDDTPRLLAQASPVPGHSRLLTIPTHEG